MKMKNLHDHSTIPLNLYLAFSPPPLNSFCPPTHILHTPPPIDPSPPVNQSYTLRKITGNL